ncbi:hypothetical protein OF83DRAFT_1084750 [Amylostereum chailletii]|nr:hypothetical protein OF83DRAFT_1084750 [Amylostereum chailletii]
MDLDISDLREYIENFHDSEDEDFLLAYSTLARELPFDALACTSNISAIYTDVAGSLVLSRLFTSFANYVPDVHRFRDLLAKTRSVVAGEFALHFILSQGAAQPGWTPDALDIFCQTPHVPYIVSFFIGDCGYTLDPNNSDFVNSIALPVLHPATDTVFCVIHVSSHAKVRIHCTSFPASEHPIPSTWGTHLMNFISVFDVVSAYPTLTLLCCIVLSANVTAAGIEDEVAVFDGWGFTVVPFNLLEDVHSDPVGLSPHCPYSHCAFDDAACARVRISTGDDKYQFDNFWSVVPEWIVGGASDTCGGGCGKSGVHEVYVVCRS